MRPFGRCAVSSVAVLSLVGAAVFVASPADATTTPRGNTTLLVCNDVAFISRIKDATGHGADNTTRNMKRYSITHTEKTLPGDPYYARFETNVNGAPDVGDTDTCSGTLTNPATTPWSGDYNPNTPIQNSGTFDEITAMAGSLNGRVNQNRDADMDSTPDECDPTPGSDPSRYVEHGTLTISFGNDGPGHVPGTFVSSDVNGRKVQSKVFVSMYNENAPDDSAAPVDGDACPDTADLVVLKGMTTKGVGEGAYFDARLAKRIPVENIVYKIETDLNVDINDDLIIGEPPLGGVVYEVFDTDVDELEYGNGPLTGTLPADYNNAFVWSIDN